MKNNVSVIGLVGLSYSGSNVLDYVLGAHEGGDGGSELLRLLEIYPQFHRRCSWYLDGCKVLTDGRVVSLTKENFHESLAEFTGKKNIIDTSKNLSWFENVFPCQSESGVDLSLLLLTKPPLRQNTRTLLKGRSWLWKRL